MTTPDDHRPAEPAAPPAPPAEQSSYTPPAPGWGAPPQGYAPPPAGGYASPAAGPQAAPGVPPAAPQPPHTPAAPPAYAAAAPPAYAAPAAPAPTQPPYAQPAAYAPQAPAYPAPAPGYPAPAPGYPAPAYPSPQQTYPGAPGYNSAAAGYQPAAPGYGAPQQYGAYPYGYAKPATGGTSWGLGFLAYIPIPFLGPLTAGIVMASVYSSQAARGPVAAGNARNAANWGLTYLLVTLLAMIGAIVGAAAFDGDAEWVSGLMVLIWMAAGVAHLVLIIMGLVRASRGQVLNVPFAIPFIRA